MSLISDDSTHRTRLHNSTQNISNKKQGLLQSPEALIKPGGLYYSYHQVNIYEQNLFFIVFLKPMFNTCWFLDYCNAEWKQTYCGPTTKALLYENRSPLLHMLHLSSFLATSRDNLKQVLKQNKDKCLITSRDNLWENSKTHANNISISFLATSKANLGKTSIKKKSVCGLLATSESRFVLRAL